MSKLYVNTVYPQAGNDISFSGDISGSGKAVFEGDIETAGDLKVSGSIVYSEFTAHTISGSKGIFREGLEAVGDVQTSGSLYARHNISGSGKGLFVGGVEAQGDIKTSGSFTAQHGVYATHLSSSGKGLFAGGVEAQGDIKTSGSFTAQHGVYATHLSSSEKAYFVGGVETAGNVMVTGTVDCNTLTASYAYIEELDVNKVNTTYTTVHEQTLEIVDKRIIIGSGSTGHDTGLIFGGQSGSFAQGTAPGASLIYDNSAGTLLLTGAAGQGNVKLGFYDDGITIGAKDDGELALSADGTSEDAIFLDSAGGITLDAGGGEIYLQDDGLLQGVVDMDTSGKFIISSSVSPNDFWVMSGKDLYLDADGDVILDANGADVSLKDAGTQFLKFTNNSGDCEIYNGAADKDIIFKDAGGNTIVTIDGDHETVKLADDKKLQFGDDGEAHIEYDEDATNKLIISGSQGPVGGVAVSGAVGFEIPNNHTRAFFVHQGSNNYFYVNTENTYVQADKEFAFGGGASIGSSANFVFGDDSSNPDAKMAQEHEYLILSGTRSGGLALSGNIIHVETDMAIRDDQKLYFGHDDNSYIEYDEDGTNKLIVSGAHAPGNSDTGGIAVSGAVGFEIPGNHTRGFRVHQGGSNWFYANTLHDYIHADKEFSFHGGASIGEDANFTFGNDSSNPDAKLAIESGFLVVSGSRSAGLTLSGNIIHVETDMAVTDDKKLYFGADDDSYIEYDEDGTNKLIVSGAHGPGNNDDGGIAVSGALGINIPSNHTRAFRVHQDGNNWFYANTLHDFVQVDKEFAFGGGASIGSSANFAFGNDSSNPDAKLAIESGYLVVSGSNPGGLALSGSAVTVSLEDNVDDAFTVKQGANSYITIETTNGDELIAFSQHMSLDDDKRFEFGTEGEAYIAYQETGTDHLIISGSHAAGLALSGSGLSIVTDEIEIKTAMANAVGAGFNGGEDGGVAEAYVAKVNGEIVTTLLVNIDDLYSSGDDGDVIGENDAANAYLTRITTAVNGLIYKAEMVCVQTPGGTNAATDIDLVASSAQLAQDVRWDSSGTPVNIISGSTGQYHEAWEAGLAMRTSASFDGIDLPNAYLYLANGEDTGGEGQYNAGKFMIKLYGVDTSWGT